MKNFFLFLIIFTCIIMSSFAVTDFVDDFSCNVGKKIDSKLQIGKAGKLVAADNNWEIVPSWDNSLFTVTYNGKGQLEMSLTDTAQNPWAQGSIKYPLGTGNFEITQEIYNIEFYDDGGAQNIIFEVWDQKLSDWEDPGNLGIMYVLTYNKESTETEKYKLSYTYRKNGDTEEKVLKEVFLPSLEFPVKLKLSWDENSKVFTGYYGLGGQEPTNFLSSTPDYSSSSDNGRWMAVTLQHEESKGKKTSLLIDSIKISGEQNAVVQPTQPSLNQQPAQLSGEQSSLETAPPPEKQSSFEPIQEPKAELKTNDSNNESGWKNYNDGINLIKSQKSQGLILFKLSGVEMTTTLQSILEKSKIKDLINSLVLIEVDAQSEREISIQYSVFRIPTIVIIDENGNAIDKWILKKEEINEDTVYNHLKSVLGK